MSKVAAVFIPGSAKRVYSIDFNGALCQDAMRGARQMAVGFHGGRRLGGAADRN
jgi:hypothetical protein